MGNSEVGHLTIGAGRVIYQDVMRITKAIEKSDFFRNDALLNAIRNGPRGHTLHLWGLLSDGSVHSHIDHLMALLELAAKKASRTSRFTRCWMGATSRRAPRCPFIEQVEAKLKEVGRGRIATVTGRYYAMDRDKRWDRVERAWRSIVVGEAPGSNRARGSRRVLRRRTRATNSSSRSSIGEPQPHERWRPGHLLQLSRRSRARNDQRPARSDFKGFARPRVPKVGYVCMTEYERG